MKILKYLFILLLLGIISLSVFVATQDGKYTIEHEKISELSDRSLYKYITDVRNLREWNPWEIKDIKADSIYSGLGANAQVKNHIFTITEVNPHQQIVYQINENESTTTLEFNLKPNTDKTTTITLKTSGKLDFIDKFKALFLGGAKAIVGAPYEKMLNNINFHLAEDLEKYVLKTQGIVYVPETYFIQQKIVSPIDNLGNEIFESMKFMKYFVQMNDFIKVTDKPFTIFGQLNMTTDNIEYYVCLPIDKEIYTAEGSDITFGKIPAHYAYKTTLTGDYTHSDKAWTKNIEEIKNKHLTSNTAIQPRAIFQYSILDTHKPSEWITEFLTPVNESIIPIIEAPNEPQNSVESPTQE